MKLQQNIMPEGPEIRLAADALAAVLNDQVVEEIEFGQAPLKKYESELTGQTISRVTNHGKAMLTHFKNGISIYSHNQLYGVWKIVRRGQLPRTKRSLRLALHTTTHSALLYSASDISVWPTENLVEHPFLKKLGPDVLDAELRWPLLRDRLLSARFSARSLAALYLDQSYLAGIGNYLRSEILFVAKVNPWQKPSVIGKSAAVRLAKASINISTQSYHTKGITNTLKREKALKSAGYRFEDRRFLVFNRESLPCYTCHQSIVNTPVGSRRLYWCPSCQAPV
jgi:endonuclease-8